MAIVTFQVPNESDTGAATTALTVTLPDVASARTETMPGWTAKLDRDAASGTVRSVTWTAAPNGGIAVDQFALFRISVQLPDTDTVSFPATQTYSDGTVVKWDQPPLPDGGEPEHPAPMLTLAAGPARRMHHHAARRPTTAAQPSSRTQPTTPLACWAEPPWSWPPWVSVWRWSAAGHETPGGRRVGGPAAGRHDVDRDPRPRKSASAHATRVSADPADNAVLATGPDRVSATFNERLQTTFAAMTVVGPDGNVWSTGDTDRAGRGRRRRPATARAGRHLHGELPGDVRGRPRGVRVLVVSADGGRHRNSRTPAAGRGDRRRRPGLAVCRW